MRASCVLAALLLLAGCTTQAATSGMSADEAAYWRVQAQLLDPRSYRLIAHETAVVPWGKPWQQVNLWRGRDDAGQVALFQRLADVRQTVALPPGTRIDVPDGSAYVSVPTDDPRLSSGESARALYFQRLRRLQTLPVRTLTATVRDPRPHQVVMAGFPPDVENGIIVGVSAMDVAWTALQGKEGINLASEISDDHAVRFAQATLVPFQRATFPGISTRAAVVPEPLSGTATVMYVTLPDDW